MKDPIPLDTPVGELYGRDAVCLEEVVLSCYPRELRVRCHLWRTGETVPCEIRFMGLVSLRVDEYDFSEFPGRASFAEIPDSPWLADCRARDHSAKVSAVHHHLVLRTYDDVIEVLCTEYKIELGSPVPDALAADDDPD